MIMTLKNFQFQEENVTILCKSIFLNFLNNFNFVSDVAAIRADIRSRLWFTYRKGFVEIGDSGHTTDRGWGCMLRCGQMVLAQALIFLHLSRDWRWKKDSREPEYLRILKMFADRRTATYSIHQIALMGVSEGKEVGQWFGPNTITQVLKKLSVYDKWSSVVIHVALDNTIVISDISKYPEVDSCISY